MLKCAALLSKNLEREKGVIGKEKERKEYRQTERETDRKRDRKEFIQIYRRRD